MPMQASPKDYALALENITCTFASRENQAARYTAVKDTTLRIAPGEFVSVVGPTGCGKSTLLNVGAGLLQPSSGAVTVFGEKLDGINKRAGYMFQAEALMPWRSALDNVTAGLSFRGVTKNEARERGEEWLKRVGLGGFGDRYPHQLSGGMRKRVALAQTFINGPEILLMDEPFSALDVQTRVLMHEELLRLWSEAKASVVFVTHDLEEAIALADKVYVLTAGPATVKSVYSIDLPRPRVVADIRYEQRFIEYSRMIWADLKEEVETSYARAAA
jgi:NitT/TauT family transport system ATP-binding protein